MYTWESIVYYIRINYAPHKNQSVLHEHGKESIMYDIRNEYYCSFRTQLSKKRTLTKRFFFLLSVFGNILSTYTGL